jgi:hypothetical protein
MVSIAASLSQFFRLHDYIYHTISPLSSQQMIGENKEKMRFYVYRLPMAPCARLTSSFRLEYNSRTAVSPSYRNVRSGAFTGEGKRICQAAGKESKQNGPKNQKNHAGAWESSERGAKSAFAVDPFRFFKDHVVDIIKTKRPYSVVSQFLPPFFLCILLSKNNYTGKLGKNQSQY